MMKLPVSPLILTLLSLPERGASGDAPAHVQSEYGQLVTSSTLLWTKSGAGHAVPTGGVSSGTGQGVICRGSRQGVGVAGETRHGRCQVVMNGRNIGLTSYEVLTQVKGASKLEWRTFERFSKVPKGAVAGVDGAEPVFVARRLARGLMETAYLEMGKEGTGYGRIAVYNEGEKVKIENQCDLLVEVEPVRYELTLHGFEKESKKTEDKKVLAATSIFRFQEGLDSTARMQKMMFYQNFESLYLGHLKGTIRGLPGRARMPTGETRELVWGMVDSSTQSESIMVGHDMEKNSAVDVEVIAMEVNEEQPYTGLLVSIFPDGSSRDREVEGVMQRSYLDRIQPHYSELHMIKEQVVGNQKQKASTQKISLTVLPTIAQPSQEKLQQSREIEVSFTQVGQRSGSGKYVLDLTVMMGVAGLLRILLL